MGEWNGPAGFIPGGFGRTRCNCHYRFEGVDHATNSARHQRVLHPCREDGDAVEDIGLVLVTEG